MCSFRRRYHAEPGTKWFVRSRENELNSFSSWMNVDIYDNLLQEPCFRFLLRSMHFPPDISPPFVPKEPMKWQSIYRLSLQGTMCVAAGSIVLYPNVSYRERTVLLVFLK